MLPDALIGLVSGDETRRTGKLFPRPPIYLQNAGGMENCCLEGTDLSVRPRDNRQRGRLLPADRPNYLRKCRLASKNEIGPLFARRTIYLRKLALVSQIIGYPVDDPLKDDRMDARLASAFAPAARQITRIVGRPASAR